MAIQLRRGDYEDFDPQKMRPAEVGVVQHNDPNTSDGKAVYVAINPGDVKRLVSDTEVQDAIYNETEEIINQIEQGIADTVAQAEAWVTGEVDGEPVSTTDPAYHNNAKYYAEQAEAAAQTLVIDDTLSVEGRAADSKVVGDIIRNELGGKTVNLLTSQPIMGERTTFDLGEDTTFPDGISVGLYCHNVSTSLGNTAFIRFYTDDGTNVANFTLNSLRNNDTGKIFSTESTDTHTGYYTTGEYEPFNSEITFRTVVFNLTSTIFDSGFADNFILKAGSTPSKYIPAISAKDYELEKNTDPFAIWSALASIRLNDVDFWEIREGLYYSNHGATLANVELFSSKVFPVKTGDVLTYDFAMSNNFPALLIFDKNRQVLSVITGQGQNYPLKGAHTFTNEECYFAFNGVISKIGTYQFAINSIPKLIKAELDNLANSVELVSDVTVVEHINPDLFAVGSLTFATGVLNYGAKTAYVTEAFLPKSIMSVSLKTTNYYITPAAYSHGEYVGCWNGTAFAKAQTYIRTSINFDDLRENYPDYQWRIVAGRMSSDIDADTIRNNVVFKEVVVTNEDSIESADIENSLNQSTAKRLESVKPLVLMHFSDIHGNQDRLKNIIDYYNGHSAYIDDIISTGDNVAGALPDGTAWWYAIDGADAILNCIGNHDCIESQATPTQILPMAELADIFFTPYVSKWNLTSYTAGTTYYYKDYDCGVRLIVLDCMHSGDETQLSWLESALDDAITNSLHVVIGYHFPVYPYDIIECGFSPVIDIIPDGSSVTSGIMQMVDAFQNNGGDFVCYITGHEHQDYMFTSQTYPNQLCLNITCATNVFAQYKAGDQSRYGKKFANAINLVTINPSIKTITVKRIGADMDIFNRERKTFAYDYGRHKVLKS